VKVEVADPPEGTLTVCGLKPVPASTMLPGRFNAVRVTDPLKPFTLVTVIE
jgi:hypothetical protein